MKHKAVIFDLFGTLVDNFSRREHRGVLAKMAESLSVPVDAFQDMWANETYVDRQTGGLPSTEANILYICRTLGMGPERAQIEAAVEVRVEFVRRGLVPRADAVSTLAELKEARVRLGLVSNCSSEVPLLWGETPFPGLIDTAVFSCEAGVMKPDPRIYLLACDRLNVSPGECLYVGDGSSRELTGAAQVGMSPLLIKVPYEASEDIHRPDEDAWKGQSISSLSEVLCLAL
jgi:putative hydrolase of the HAD superfamily